MKESYEKGLANRSASNPTLAMVTSRVWHGQEVHAGQVLSSEITTFACPHCPDARARDIAHIICVTLAQVMGCARSAHHFGEPIGFMRINDT